MTTQPQFPNPGSPGAGPVAPSGGRPPRRPQPVIPASSAGTQQQPTPQAHRRTPSIRAPQPTVSSPPNPPIPPGPNRPLNRPELAQIERPAPSRVFWKKLLRAQSTPVSVSPFSNQEPPPFHHPGVFSRDPAATSKPGSPCHPVNPASPASPSRETRPAHRPSQRPSRRRRLANSPKKTASSYLWPAGPQRGPAGQR